MDRKDQQNAHALRTRLAGDQRGGAAASDRVNNETENKKSVERSSQRAALDNSHESSRRGEHRYPDAHQTTAERKGRDDRDALKQKLGDPR